MIEIEDLQIPDNLIPDNIFSMPETKVTEPEEAHVDVEQEAADVQEEAVEEKPKKKTKKATKQKVEQPLEEEVIEDEIDDTPIAIFGTDITEKKLQSLKDKYKHVYKSVIAGDIFIWHRLSRKEFGECITNTYQIDDIQERIELRERMFCETACHYPSGAVLNNIFADNEVVCTSLAEEILQRSGFSRPETSEL